MRNDSKLEALGRFVSDHPVISAITALMVNGWVMGFLSVLGNKTKEKNIIDGQYEEVKE